MRIGRRPEAPSRVLPERTVDVAEGFTAEDCRTVLESVQANIFVTDPDLKIMYVNPKALATMRRLEPALLRAVNLRADQLLGLNLTGLHEDPARLERVLRDSGVPSQDVEFHFEDVTLGAYVNHLNRDGRHAGFVFTWADITQKVGASRRAQRLSERLDETQEVSAAIQAVARAAEQMAEAANDIARNAGEATQTVARAVDSVEAANRTMAELSAASEKINDIVKTITQVADQTNLLALNATIEAARAGEAGRGFAVVAGEVKDLSRQTKAATERINQMIRQVQSLSNAASQAIGNISAVVEQLRTKQHSIAGAVEAQTNSTNDISVNVATAAERAQSIATFVAANR